MAIDGRGGEGERVWPVDTAGGAGSSTKIFSAEVCRKGRQDAEAVVFGGWTDGPAGDFDRRCWRDGQRVEGLSTSVYTVMEVEAAKMWEGHGTRRVGRSEWGRQ